MNPRPSPPILYAINRTRTAAAELLGAVCRLRPSPRVLETGFAILVQELQRPAKFELGQLLMTPGADEAMRAGRHVPPEFLLRHKHGDWGDLPPEDLQENERALRDGSRLFSADHTRTDEKLWMITEWDRSVTTLLLPEEYYPRGFSFY